MTHDTSEHIHEPMGRSPQRVIQRPRVPDAVWRPAIGKAHRIGRPIGHVIGELLADWLARPDVEPESRLPASTTIRRRPRTPGRDRTRHYHAPDDIYDAALAAAHRRGFSLASYIVEQLERLAAEDASRP